MIICIDSSKLFLKERGDLGNFVVEIHSLRIYLLLSQASRAMQKGKSMIRRKSELAHDYAILSALEKHKRPNEFLSSATEANPNAH